MKNMPVTELRRSLGAITRALVSGQETIVLTSHECPVGVLMPMARLHELRALHIATDNGRCATCFQVSPCATVRVLDYNP